MCKERYKKAQHAYGGISLESNYWIGGYKFELNILCEFYFCEFVQLLFECWKNFGIYNNW